MLDDRDHKPPSLHTHGLHTPSTVSDMTPHGTRATSPTLGPTRSRTSAHSVRSNIGIAAEPDPPQPGDPELPLEGAPLDIGPPPDGGREAWLCVAGTFLQLFCIFGLCASLQEMQS